MNMKSVLASDVAIAFRVIRVDERKISVNWVCLVRYL